MALLERLGRRVSRLAAGVVDEPGNRESRPSGMRYPVTPDGRYFVVRGPVWWEDGAPDYNRRLLKNTPYSEVPSLRLE